MPTHSQEPPSAAGRLTLAIGLFDGVAPVETVMTELRQMGVALQTARLFASIDSDAFSRRRTERLERDLAIERVKLDDSRSDGDWLSAVLPRAASLVEGEPHCGTCASDRAAASVNDLPAIGRQSRRLMAHLSIGGSILVIRADTFAEQQAICGLMLNHAAAGILTHQTRTPAGAPEPWPSSISAIGDPAAAPLAREPRVEAQ